MRAATVPLHSSNSQKLETPNFDKLARIYRWMEYLSFGPALWRCRCAFLGNTAHCRNALVIGDGDGRFTARLLETNSTIRVHAVDASPAMLHALMRRAGANVDRVRTTAMDARAWQPSQSEPFDLVVTHFFLDCLTTEEVKTLAQKIHAASAPGMEWVVSEFVVSRSFFGRMVAGPLVAALYLAFGILTGLRVRAMPDYAAALSKAGFSLSRRNSRLGGLLASELWTLTESSQAHSDLTSSR